MACFIYKVWNPSTTATEAPNGTNLDIFCGSQLLRPSGNSIVIRLERPGQPIDFGGGPLTAGRSGSNHLRETAGSLSAGDLIVSATSFLS
jgi:hypothetical protein